MTSPFEKVAAMLHDAHDQSRFSAAACLLAVEGERALETYIGEQAAWTASFAPIPLEERSPVTPATLFDLASVTKVFTAHTVLTMVDAGLADLDVPIADVLPSFEDVERRQITLRHLLTHTSGLPPEWTGWAKPLRARLEESHSPERFTASPLLDMRGRLVDDLLSTPLDAKPGTEFIYSCAGYNTAMLYLERLTERSWPALTEQFTTGPLELPSVTAIPLATTTAATEYQPRYRRGVIRGDVHDEAAWSLGGHSANAGLFCTARDLLRLGEAIRRGEGRVTGEWMWDDALTQVLGRSTADSGGGFGAAMGLRIGDRESMSAAGPSARSHIGFTGTLLHIDRLNATTLVLLTNRVHPSRTSDIVDLRSQIVEILST